jgi:hypothetical protein
MEKVTCKCEKASMTYYHTEEEDLWCGVAENTLIVKEGYGKACICKECKTTYDHFDPCMVKIFKK